MKEEDESRSKKHGPCPASSCSNQSLGALVSDNSHTKCEEGESDPHHERGDPTPTDGERFIPSEGVESSGGALERESPGAAANIVGARAASTEETPSRPAPRRWVSSARSSESTRKRGTRPRASN
jgi:hypothetical protein